MHEDLDITRIYSLSLLLAPGEAEARRGGSSSEFMEFVAETAVPGPSGQAFSLCHLIKKHSVLFIPVYFTSEGYVLAENRCDATQYRSLDAAALAEGQQLGFLPADIPAEPDLSTGQTAAGYVTLALLGLFALAVITALIRKGRNRSARMAEIGEGTHYARQMIDVMCHVARADGVTEANEASVIAAVARNLTGAAYPTEQVERMIQLSETGLQRGDFKRFAKGLEHGQKENVMRAALMVAASDGSVGKKEQEFLSGLAQALALRGDRVGELLAEVVRPAGA